MAKLAEPVDYAKNIKVKHNQLKWLQNRPNLYSNPCMNWLFQSKWIGKYSQHVLVTPNFHTPICKDLSFLLKSF